MKWLRGSAAILLLLAALPLARAQSTRPEDLATGKLLVASRDLPDPNFAQTVVLLVDFDEDGVLGLILNRPAPVTVSHVLRDVAGAKDRKESVYAGGPVGSANVLALMRSRGQMDDARHVLGDVFLVSSKSLLEKAFASASESANVRIYVGYAGWTRPQLENEVDQGSWYIFQGNAATVFESNPRACGRA
jgi:putative transcriptional regulator